MPPAQTIQVNPEVLVWARESAGLSPSEAAKRLSVSLNQLEKWESGEHAPTMGQFTNMTKVYQRPPSALLLPDVPPLPPRPKDFRTIQGQGPAFSLATLVAVRDAQRIQGIADELLEDAPDLLPRSPLPQISGLQGDPEDAGAGARGHFGVSVADQLGWESTNQALNAWRHKLHGMGIITLSKPMPREDCRGFSLYDEGTIPVIVVNRYENEQAKIFTLFHEYAHLLLRDVGICSQRDSVGIERWCNRFAAAFLVSPEALSGIVEDDTSSDLEKVRTCARAFKVSRHVVALRMAELNLAPSGLYHAVKAEDEETEDWERPSAKPDRRPMIRTEVLKFSELGGGYSRIVLTALERGMITRSEATDYLDISETKLDRFTQRAIESLSRYG